MLWRESHVVTHKVIQFSGPWTNCTPGYLWSAHSHSETTPGERMMAKARRSPYYLMQAATRNAGEGNRRASVITLFPGFRPGGIQQMFPRSELLESITIDTTVEQSQDTSRAAFNSLLIGTNYPRRRETRRSYGGSHGPRRRMHSARSVLGPLHPVRVMTSS